MLEIQIKTTEETERMLSLMPAKWSNALFEGVGESVRHVKDYIKRSFGKPGWLKVKTGALKQSVIGETQKRTGVVVGILSSDLAYSAIHEYGGTIRAKSKEYLTFQIGGKWVKVRQVVIPARPYLRPGIVDNLDPIANIITDRISKEMNY